MYSNYKLYYNRYESLHNLVFLTFVIRFQKTYVTLNITVKEPFFLPVTIMFNLLRSYFSPLKFTFAIIDNLDHSREMKNYS